MKSFEDMYSEMIFWSIYIEDMYSEMISWSIYINSCVVTFYFEIFQGIMQSINSLYYKYIDCFVFVSFFTMGVFFYL